MDYKFYKELHHDARFIRKEVFMKEQGFQNEFDEVDARALHLVLYMEGKPVATGRMFTTKKGEYTIGRVAVLPKYRREHLGAVLLELLEKKAKELGGTKLTLSAQCSAVGFYEKQGYIGTGDIYLDEACEHMAMEKNVVD